MNDVWVFAWAKDGHIEAEVYRGRSTTLRALQQFVRQNDIETQGQDWIDESDSEIERLVLYCGEAGYDMICEPQTP